MKIKKVILLPVLLTLCVFSHAIPHTAARSATRPGPISAAPVSRGMVSSSNRLASEVGAEILRKGGNAVDAAVAIGIALAVTYPAAGNLGGGGFMVVLTKDGKASAIDYRETAPARAERNMYLDKKGNLIASASTVGYRAAGVPGTVAGLSMALEKYGTMKWRDVVEPARVLASEGFAVSEGFAKDLRTMRKLLGKFPESRKIFLRGGWFYRAGSVFRQPELAETLRRLQDEGAREFYEGKTARLIAESMTAHGGLITLDDLRRYKPVERQPLRGRYREYEIITMPPPSSGGVALLEMLNMLEHYDVAEMGHNTVETSHIIVEVMRRAFADRAAFGRPRLCTDSRRDVDLQTLRDRGDSDD
jgi:gamma-glutamyltranspeptidase/glutathione hydrolase